MKRNRPFLSLLALVSAALFGAACSGGNGRDPVTDTGDVKGSKGSAPGSSNVSQGGAEAGGGGGAGGGAAGGGGSAVGGVCDDSGSCEGCGQCAIVAACSASWVGCNNDAQCSSALRCLGDCRDVCAADQVCYDACADNCSAAEAGMPAAQQLIGCVCHQACTKDCASQAATDCIDFLR